MRTQRIGKLDMDQPTLLKELERTSEFEFVDAYSDFLCGGKWKSCMLWSMGGKTGDGFITNYDPDKPSSKTKYAERMPYLSGVVERSFNLKHLNFARIAILPPNSVIVPHKDLLEVGKMLHRIHVPLITNDLCYFSHGNVVYRMRFGEAWFFDAATMHSAASFSDDNRIHLILDFEDVDDPYKLILFDRDKRAEIPQESIGARTDLTAAERESLLSLSSVIDMDNYKDIFSMLVKKQFRKDGGDNFVWDTFMKISMSSSNQDVKAKVSELHQYFMIARAA